jgi:hypothetical protein
VKVLFSTGVGIRGFVIVIVSTLCVRVAEKELDTIAVSPLGVFEIVLLSELLVDLVSVNWTVGEPVPCETVFSRDVERFPCV